MQTQTPPTVRPEIRPTDRALKTYQTERAAKLDQGVFHELGVRPAFRNLLDTAARQFGWTLFDEEQIKLGSRSIRPDGTLRDSFHLRRGYWEAKDTGDDLDAEIEKKSDLHVNYQTLELYPLEYRETRASRCPIKSSASWR
ncbi:MAG: hypothetical protein ACYDBJ_10950 [Aggregatilineales bacterium]